MLKYIIVPLSEDAVSFCHYERNNGSSKLISIEHLKMIITWSMKENLYLHFLFPDEEIPSDYKDAIDSVDHVSIVPSTCSDASLLKAADVVVFDSWGSITSYPYNENQRYVIRTSKDDFFEQARFLKILLTEVNSMVVVIKDIDKFSEVDYVRYKEILNSLVPFIAQEIINGRNLQFNLITDRVFLDKMNNCGAGDESITYATDGKFYICPAFCNEEKDFSLGDLEKGIKIKNPQLYKLAYAPICRLCDAYQCHRCIWLNNKTTLEVNTPSHQQCVVSHIERNVSQRLAKELKKNKGFENLSGIKDINYLDPFELILNKN